jgi:hypothetical protein
MQRYLLYLLLFFNFLFFISCKKDKFKSPESAFLVADKVLLKTISGQGSNSHKITDIWYYVNGKFQGVFPVGKVMPIVTAGNTEITLLAGIKNNGISATRVPYQMFKSVTINQNVEPGKTYVINPEFEYNSNAFFYYSDNFEPGGSFFVSTGDSAYSNTATFDPSKSFEGLGSIFMSMSDAKPTAEMKQTQAYFLPANGETIYLELNYKCNQPFTVGVIGGGVDRRTALTVNPSSEWNKIYIQLTSAVSAQPNYPSYQVFIRANKEVNSPEIFIDNVKLIYL